MKILFFVSDYPFKDNNNFVFVKQLVDQMAELGNKCFVISPFSVIRNKGFTKSLRLERKGNEGTVVVLRPNYLSIPFLKIGRFIPSEWLRMRAMKRSLDRLKEKPDVIYCHFWNQGLIGYEYAKKWGVPLFVATGESDIAKLTKMEKVTPEFVEYVSGVICVSSKCKDESINLGLTTSDKCIVIPNAIDANKFYLVNKLECRKKLNVPEDAFIVCFVGWFIERKGPIRVSKAIENTGNSNIYSFFIGKGQQDVNSSHVLFKGSVVHDRLIIYLNAADVFVLPTLNEGCCNAVIEAMACGLPVISSNLPFNKDVLNETNSILIDPNDTNQIAEAILKLYQDKILRQRLSAGAILSAQNLTIDQRAKKIISFIESRI
jgi:glycosyltransferase involved in cell wall biosynthesis